MIQAQFINYLLSSKDKSIISLNCLDKRYFPDYQSEWEFIESHLKVYGVIPDKETFAKQFENFEWMDVQETPSYLIDELFKDYQMRQIVCTINKVRDCAVSGDRDKAVSICKDLGSNLSTGVSLQCADLMQDTSRFDHYVEKTKDLSKYYLTTGFPELDGIFGGIDRKEELGVIIARTNLGKSFLAIKMASASVAQGLRVGFYSGEMSSDKVGYRLDTLLGNVNNGAITHGNVSAEVEYKNYIDGLKRNYSGHFFILTPKDVNGNVGVSVLRAFIEKYALDILFVDQIPLLSDDRKGKSREEKLSNIIIDLKNLQTLKQMPIICVTQQNRVTTEDGSIDSSQIAGSDDIGKFATFVLGISRDKKDETLMNFHIVKTRDSNGANAKLTYKVDLNRGIFTYIPGENDRFAQSANDNSRYTNSRKDEGDVF